MRNNKKTIKVELEGGIEYYKKENNSEIYKKLPKNKLTRPFICGVLRNRRSRNTLVVYNEIKKELDEENNNESTTEEFPQEIIEAIMNRSVVAATNALMEEDLLAMYWIITNM